MRIIITIAILLSGCANSDAMRYVYVPVTVQMQPPIACPYHPAEYHVQ
jgi:hypothetical protein